MKKRINLVQKGNKKMLCYTALVVLTKSQAEKLACEGLIKRIDGLSKDLNVDWAVEISGNYEIAAISRTTQAAVIEEEMLSSLEKAAHEFICAVDKMEMPLPEPAQEAEQAPGDEHELTEEDVECTVSACIDLLSKKNALKSIIIMSEPEDGSLVKFLGIQEVPIGEMIPEMFIELLKCYIDAHAK